MSDDKKASILGHFRELRKRLLWSAIAVVITSTICFFFADHIFDILKTPAGDIELIFIEMSEGFATYMRVCLVSGIILAMPVIMYNFLMFLLPALTRKEKKMVLIILPWVIVMFAGGVYFAYRFLIPPATQFLLTFGSSVAVAQIRLSNYVNFITRLLLAIGIIFEMPVVTTFLARMGIISSKWLAQRRKFMIIFAFVLGAFITPTPDAVNQSIVAGTLIVLYEMCIWLAKLVQKKKPIEEITNEPLPVSGGSE